LSRNRDHAYSITMTSSKCSWWWKIWSQYQKKN